MAKTGRPSKTKDPELMARVDAIARILAQALGSYLLSTASPVQDGGGELFSGAGCFSTTVDLNEPASRRKRSA